MNDLPDHGPIQRLEAVKADPLAPDVVFQRVCEGESLKVMAESWKVPKGKFVQWFTTMHGDLYDAALKVHAAELALDTLGIADEQKEATGPNGKVYDPEVGRDRLRIDARKWIASKFDRDRYGEAMKSESKVTVDVSAGLVGFASALLEHIDKRPGLILKNQRVLDHENNPGHTVTLSPFNGDDPDTDDVI